MVLEALCKLESTGLEENAERLLKTRGLVMGLRMASQRIDELCATKDDEEE
jgi:hypothetical protein